MRILGIDFGDKRIGLAMSDPLGYTAQGLTVVAKQATFAEDALAIKEAVKDYDEITAIVIGLPKTLSGEIGLQAQKVLEFAKEIEAAFNLKAITWDERMTTAGAEKFLISAGVSRKKRKQVIDKTAAVYILQSYLDSRR